MKITIITPTRNSENTIKQNLQSINSQSYKKIEHIIIDGKSKDKTLEIIARFKKKKITKVFSSNDKGMYYALNKGLRLATGKVICFLNSDDYYPDKKIISSVIKIFKNSKSDIVYGDLIYVKKNKKIFRKWRSQNFEINLLNKGWMPPHPATFIKKKIIKKKNYFNINFEISSDYDFLINLFNKKKNKSKYFNKVLVHMLTGGKSNKNLSSIFKKTYEDYLIIKKNKIGGLYTLILKNFSKLNQLF